MSHPNATPRPWTLDTIEGGGWAVVVDANGDGAKVIAELDETYGDRAANAALIVEAVNAYRTNEPEPFYDGDGIPIPDSRFAGITVDQWDEKRGETLD